MVKKSGFSIAELSVVIIVIALLTGVVITSSKMSRDAKLVVAQSLTKSSPVADIDGLEIWYESTMPQSFDDQIDNGDSIAVWNDLSSNVINATQSTSTLQPIYTSNAINGLPAIRLDGIDDWIGFSTSDNVTNSFTTFIVAKNAAGQTHEIDAQNNVGSVGTSGQKYLIHPTYKSSDGGLGISFGTNGISFYEHGAGYMPALAVYENNAIGTTQTIITQILNSRSHLMYYNGSLVITGLNSIKPTVFAPENLGGRNYGNWAGDVGEFILFNRVLSTQEQEDVERYLANKWNIDI